MYNFATWLTRSYHQSIGWNEDNLYSNLTRSSSGKFCSCHLEGRCIFAHCPCSNNSHHVRNYGLKTEFETQMLTCHIHSDFEIPPSFILQLSKSPSPIFFTSYALEVLPRLNGSISYVTSSIPLEGIEPSQMTPLKSMTPHFETYPPPKRPVPPDEQWLSGELVVPPRDYLLYSRLHLPSLHLSALASTKLSPSIQASLAFIHSPGALFMGDGGSSSTTTGNTNAPSSTGGGSGNTSSSSSPPASPSPPGNLLLSLQQDTGRWATEYSYSAKDGMVGLRGLWNFGLTDEMLKPVDTYASPPLRPSQPSTVPLKETETSEGQTKSLVDQENDWENGLRGRFSAGGEIYFSVKQRSLGCESVFFISAQSTLVRLHEAHAQRK